MTAPYLANPPPMKQAEYWSLIAGLPCLICKRETLTEIAHVRHGKGAGMGLKSPFWCVVPLCHEHHRNGPQAQHNRGETVWAEMWGIDLQKICDDLWALRGWPEMMWNYVVTQEVRKP